MHRLVWLIAVVACSSAGPRYSGTVRVADARLVAVNPDVATLADADRPVFFARGRYFLFADGRWFTARAPAGPWSFESRPPIPIVQLDQPYAYVHDKRDARGRQIETVARGPVPAPETRRDRRRTDRRPAAIDPSVDQSRVR